MRSRFTCAAVRTGGNINSDVEVACHTLPPEPEKSHLVDVGIFQAAGTAACKNPCKLVCPRKHDPCAAGRSAPAQQFMIAGSRLGGIKIRFLRIHFATVDTPFPRSWSAWPFSIHFLLRAASTCCWRRSNHIVVLTNESICFPSLYICSLAWASSSNRSLGFVSSSRSCSRSCR